MTDFEVGNLVLLNTVYLRLRGVSGKLRKKFIEPFRVIERMVTQSYRLLLPQEWTLQIFFHISLLKDFMSLSICKNPQILMLMSWNSLAKRCQKANKFWCTENEEKITKKHQRVPHRVGRFSTGRCQLGSWREFFRHKAITRGHRLGTSKTRYLILFF